MERLLPDGRWLLVTERRTEDGGTVGIRTDITALKAALTETAAARDAARTATEAKSRFLAHMSHELRTPLNGVLGLAQALAADPALAPAQRERARTLEAAGRHLVAVANDVLDLAKIEAGRFELRPAALALPELLRECVGLGQGRRGEQADRAPHRHRAGPAAFGGGGRNPPAPARAQLPVERGEVHPARRPGGDARHRRLPRPGNACRSGSR